MLMRHLVVRFDHHVNNFSINVLVRSLDVGFEIILASPQLFLSATIRMGTSIIEVWSTFWLYAVLVFRVSLKVILCREALPVLAIAYSALERPRVCKFVFPTKVSSV